MDNEKMCCDVFLKIAPFFKWHALKPENILLMPCINVNGIDWRVNNCPSCGKNIRDIQIKPEQLIK